MPSTEKRQDQTPLFLVNNNSDGFMVFNLSFEGLKNLMSFLETYETDILLQVLEGNTAIDVALSYDWNHYSPHGGIVLNENKLQLERPVQQGKELEIFYHKDKKHWEMFY
jgi:hypothetical protein